MACVLRETDRRARKQRILEWPCKGLVYLRASYSWKDFFSTIKFCEISRNLTKFCGVRIICKTVITCLYELSE